MSYRPAMQSDRSSIMSSQLHRSDFLQGVEHELSYRGSWLVIAFGLIGALVTLFATGMGLGWSSLAPYLLLTLMLAATQVFCCYFRANPRFAGFCGMIAVLVSSMLLAAVISHTSLRLGMPFVDPVLSAADKSIGWYSPNIVLKIAEFPQFCKALGTIYNTTVLACLVCGLMLVVSGQVSRASEFAWCYVVCVLVASLSAIFMPALGSTVYHGIEDVSGLPAGAGNFHLPIVEYYRNNPTAEFDLGKTSGIVTFPSFHMVMALLVPYGLRGTGGLFWCAAGWGGLVTLAAVVIGGHYLVDLIVGTLCWAGAVKTAAYEAPPDTKACGI